MKDLKRCPWCGENPLYIDYHDNEWGKPVFDDKVLFEMLILEGFQAGLSWITILKKRENFRKAFDNFEIDKILEYDENKFSELLQNSEIIRHRLKIQSVQINAQAFIKVQKEFGSFSNYLWDFVEGEPIINLPQNIQDIPTSTPLSDKISKDLKKRGFKFVGSTIIYAYIQAIGLVNDHIQTCFKSQNS